MVQWAHCAFGGSVRQNAGWGRPVCLHRAGGDGGGLRFQVRQRRLAQREDGKDVRAVMAFEILGRNVGPFLECVLVRSIVDQHVQRAELSHGALHPQLAVRWIADVSGQGQHAPSNPADQAGSVFGIALSLRDETTTSAPRRHCFADSTVCSGDQGHLPPELPAALVRRSL